ncbi:MAG: UDP-N-acetylmuramoyl-L-alanine--D-glutamate ligase [Campylobacterota bacterium]|nr:UDP-N-acetylmuramoyl-L-alanine--D-glutamate ligase [Campylobacterota bacterium]
MRILGKGQTAQSLHQKYPSALMYDDGDKEKFNLNSDELTVVSPGIPPSNEMVKNSLNTCSDYDLFAQSMPYSIWISGTNGKTTTTQMIQHLLEKHGSVYGGNIGVPITTLNSDAKYWILETSSFTLHYTKKAKPNIYILLPISDDHVSWHGTFELYEQAKLKPLSMMNANDTAIIPERYGDIETHAKVITYTGSKDLAQKFHIDTTKIKFNDPFLMDSLMALICSKLLEDEIDYDRMNCFEVDEHKVEELRDKNGYLWVNDSKATNVDATIWALKGYKNRKIYLILGGDDKEADLHPLFKELKNYDVEIFTIGTNTDRLNDLAKEYNISSTLYKVLSEAVHKIKSILNDDPKKAQKCVSMLSPAASSLDQFSSYATRGKEFKNLVLN